MSIVSTQLMTPIKPYDQPVAPLLDRTSKALAITQIALVALAFAGALAFVIATAVTLNAYFLIGAGICSIVAFAVLGRNLCCRAIANREETVFVPRHDDLYNDQSFIEGIHLRSPLLDRQIPWPKFRIPETRLSSNRVIPNHR